MELSAINSTKQKDHKLFDHVGHIGIFPSTYLCYFKNKTNILRVTS
jgi:hypothetical protein